MTANRDLLDPRVADHLDWTGVPYQVVAIDPEYADTAAFCARYGFPPEQSVNTIIVASRRVNPTVYCACLVLATTRLDVNRRVKELMGVSRLSFASAEQMAALTGMEAGGVTAFGLPVGLPVYVDSRISGLEWVILGGGGRAAKVKVSPTVFETMPAAEFVDDLANEVA